LIPEFKLKLFMKQLFIGLPFLCFIWAGCSTHRAVTSYAGLDKKTLYKEYGPPVAVINNGRKGEILIYKKPDNSYVPGMPISASGITVQVRPYEGPGREKTERYYVDTAGIVYRFRRG
jgi:hypothetical protein